MTSEATRIKFCGITSLDDAELCAAHGAWALGLMVVSALATYVILRLRGWL